MEVTIEYWNELAKQMILISSLLSGFSIAVVANILVSDKKDDLINKIMKSATVSASCFLITLFSMVQISMLTTPGGYLENITPNDFALPRFLGAVSFLIGLISLSTTIALSGWTKSKKVGKFTTIIGILTLILITLTLINTGS